MFQNAMVPDKDACENEQTNVNNEGLAFNTTYLQ